jgi:hypothetical protein
VLVGLAIVYFQRSYMVKAYAFDYGPPHDRFLSRLLAFSHQNHGDNKVAARECKIRAFITLTVLIAEYNIHALVHTLASIIGVGLLRQSPSQWRPVYEGIHHSKGLWNILSQSYAQRLYRECNMDS